MQTGGNERNLDGAVLTVEEIETRELGRGVEVSDSSLDAIFACIFLLRGYHHHHQPIMH